MSVDEIAVKNYATQANCNAVTLGVPAELSIVAMNEVATDLCGVEEPPFPALAGACLSRVTGGPSTAGLIARCGQVFRS